MRKESLRERKPEVECIAALAMRLSGPHLADYGAARSRKDFTQRQLMACLALRAYLPTTYRGVLETLAGHGSLRAALHHAAEIQCPQPGRGHRATNHRPHRQSGLGGRRPAATDGDGLDGIGAQRSQCLLLEPATQLAEAAIRVLAYVLRR